MADEAAPAAAQNNERITVLNENNVLLGRGEVFVSFELSLLFTTLLVNSLMNDLKLLQVLHLLYT